MFGEKWRNLRAKLSPVFSSAKLKAMFSTLLDCGVPLKRYLNREAEEGNIVEMREIAARYTTDIIGTILIKNEKSIVSTQFTYRLKVQQLSALK